MTLGFGAYDDLYCMRWRVTTLRFSESLMISSTVYNYCDVEIEAHIVLTGKFVVQYMFKDLDLFRDFFCCLIPAFH